MIDNFYICHNSTGIPHRTISILHNAEPRFLAHFYRFNKDQDNEYMDMKRKYKQGGSAESKDGITTVFFGVEWNDGLDPIDNTDHIEIIKELIGTFKSYDKLANLLKNL